MFDGEINAIVEKIAVTLNPQKIYLFGSFAKGTQTPSSDYDFYVIVPDDAGDSIKLSQKAYRSLRGIRKRPVDILVNHETKFNDLAKEFSMEREISTEGILLYAK